MTVFEADATVVAEFPYHVHSDDFAGQYWEALRWCEEQLGERAFARVTGNARDGFVYHYQPGKLWTFWRPCVWFKDEKTACEFKLRFC